MISGGVVICRHCKSPLTVPFLNLGSVPPSNAFLSEVQLNAKEIRYPLRLLVCSQCWLVQTEDYAGRETLFTEEYADFSSFSSSWLAHAKRFVDEMIVRFGLAADKTVVEIAANDGYLLQFVQQHGIDCYGIEPTQNTAEAARAKGIEIFCEFFGSEMAQRLAKQGCCADLVVSNNVLAHVPDINDFVSGFTFLLKPNGVASFEFPHLLQMVKYNQFDTAYHEHYSYLSLTTVKKIFDINGLKVFDVQELSTHGGSLRVYAQKKNEGQHPVSPAVAELLSEENSAGISSESFYKGMQNRAELVKHNLLSFLNEAKRQGNLVVAYGAAAKGNTLLNFCGISKDIISYVADASPYKQGKFLPGSHIPVVTEKCIKKTKPHYVLILPWNLKKEITQQLQYIRQWGGKFLVPIPQLDIV
jgi:SAM-dependent methyltransferase